MLHPLRSHFLATRMKIESCPDTELDSLKRLAVVVCKMLLLRTSESEKNQPGSAGIYTAHRFAIFFFGERSKRRRFRPGNAQFWKLPQ